MSSGDVTPWAASVVSAVVVTAGVVFTAYQSRKQNEDSVEAGAYTRAQEINRQIVEDQDEEIKRQKSLLQDCREELARVLSENERLRDIVNNAIVVAARLRAAIKIQGGTVPKDLEVLPGDSPEPPGST